MIVIAREVSEISHPRVGFRSEIERLAGRHMSRMPGRSQGINHQDPDTEQQLASGRWNRFCVGNVGEAGVIWRLKQKSMAADFSMNHR